VQVVKFLIKNNADVNLGILGQNYTPLMSAVINENLEIVEMLLENGARVNDISIDERSALHFAAMTGNQEIVHFLLNHKAEINQNSKSFGTPLYLACAHDNIEIVQFLLEQGAKINLGRLRDGVTPLMTATMEGHIQVVQYLLENKFEKIDVNELSCRGESILHIAMVQNENPEIVKILIEYGANIHDSHDPDEIPTPLMFATALEYLKIMEMLIDAGADVNQTSGTEGFSPIHEAAYNGRLKAFKLLIQRGANVYAKTKSGFTVQKIAFDNQHEFFFDFICKTYGFLK
jgi:ankyrin repeat protein